MVGNVAESASHVVPRTPQSGWYTESLLRYLQVEFEAADHVHVESRSIPLHCPGIVLWYYATLTGLCLGLVTGYMTEHKRQLNLASLLRPSFVAQKPRRLKSMAITGHLAPEVKLPRAGLWSDANLTVTASKLFNSFNKLKIDDTVDASTF